jgi:hypothetical protein
MTSEEISAILGAGRGPAIGHLSRVRRNDLEGIARSHGVTPADGESQRLLATRIVNQVFTRAKRDSQPRRAGRGRK